MILSLKEIHSESIGGSKAWNLAKAISAGARVPKTLVVPSTEISEILMNSGIRHEVFELSRSLVSGDMNEDLLRKERSLKSMISSLEFPEGLISELVKRVNAEEYGLVIVRPSPFYPEISEGDLKGRMRVWYCRPDERELREALSKVLSESFNLRSIARLLDLGVHPEDLDLALIVQEAVIPRSSGMAVCYPAGRSEILIKSTWGSANDVPMDKFRIGIELGELIESEITEKKNKLLPTHLGLKEVEVESDLWIMPSLSKEEVREIANVSLDLSVIFGTPTTVEWMLQEGTNLLYVIQAYRESGRPKMKSLERKVIDLMERGIPEKPVARSSVETTVRDVAIAQEASFPEELPLLASRVYLSGLSGLPYFDGSILRQEALKETPKVSGKIMLLIEEGEHLDEEALRNCGKIIVKSKDVTKAGEIAERIRSLAPATELFIYSEDLGSLILNKRISDLFEGVLLPVVAIYGADDTSLEQFLNIIRRRFRSFGVDLQEEIPDIDLISSLIKMGVDYFVFSRDLALKQARIVSRAERRILLDSIRFRRGG